MSDLILDDSFRTLSLVGDSSGGEGITLQEWVAPLPTYEATYAEGPESEGRRKIRERPQNGQGSAKGFIGAQTEPNFWDYVDNLQEMVESVRREKGSLRYEPPHNGTAVTFDLETISVSGLPQHGVLLNSLTCEWEIALEALPYARLDPITVFTDQPISGPIGYVEVPSITGHVEAWAELTLADISSATRSHVEVGLQTDYAPAAPEPLLLNLASGLTVSGFAGSSTTRTGSYSTNVARATLSASPVVVCSTTAQPHKDLWEGRTRVYPSSDDIRVRLSWRVGDGPITPERWITVPNSGNFYELALETISIRELVFNHSWTGYIEAYSPIGTASTIDVDTILMVPA